MPLTQGQNSAPTINLPYDYLYFTGNNTYNIDQIVSLLNYSDADDDVATFVALFIESNAETSFDAGFYADEQPIPLDENYYINIAEARNQNTVFSGLPADGFSIVNAWFAVSDGTDWSEWDHFFIVSPAETKLGTENDDEFNYTATVGNSVIIDGGSGHDTVNLTIPDIDWRLITSIDADDDDSETKSYIVLDEIEELSLSLDKGTNWYAEDHVVERVTIGDEPSYVKLNFGDPDVFVAGDQNDTLDASRFDFGISYDGVQNTLKRNTITDYVANFEFIVATNYDDKLYGRNNNDLTFLQVSEAIIADSWDNLGVGQIDGFRPKSGADVIDGRQGFDLINYYDNDAPSGVTLSFKTGLVTDNYGDTDTISNLEGVRGSSLIDYLEGNDEFNFFEPMYGNDTIDGLGGIDLVSYEADEFAPIEMGVIANLSDAQNFLPQQFQSLGLAGQVYYQSDTIEFTDTFLNIEALAGTSGMDVIIGDDNDNYLYGLGSFDHINGGYGNDLISGGATNDDLYSVAGSDLIHGGKDDDAIYLSSAETFGRLFFASNSSTGEKISLNGYNHYSATIDGGEDADALFLGNNGIGNALFLHDAFSNHHHFVQLEDDGMGKLAAARITNIETIYGSELVDIIDLTSPKFVNNTDMIIATGDQDDVIWAAFGDDELYGGTGDDILFGNKGDDTLSGGEGVDTFEFVTATTRENDIITDYEDGDVLKFYLNAGDTKLRKSDYSDGVLSWGNLTISIDQTGTLGWDDLSIVYA